MKATTTTTTWLLVALAGAALVVHARAFDFITDDAYISFVYARNLARHGQLVFNLGERVEGYTNFLWTVMLAGLLRLGVAPEIASRVLGAASAVATMAACAHLTRRTFAAAAWSAWDALPAVLLAGVSGFACWSSGGLETQLYTFFVTLGIALYARGCFEGRAPALGSAVAFGLASLTRPEGILFFGLTAIHHAATRVRARRAPTVSGTLGGFPNPPAKGAFGRAELAWGAAWAAFVVPHFAWRRWYYGWWLPNTFYIKTSGGHGTWARGAYYLARFIVAFHLWIVPLLAIAALVAARGGAAEPPPLAVPAARFRALLAYVAWLTAGFLVYVASIGGDFIGLFRFALPIVPALAVIAALSLRIVAARAATASARRRPALVAAVLLVPALGAHFAHQAAVTRAALRVGSDNGIDTPGYLKEYTANRAAIGRWFHRHARPDDFAAVGGAGAQVYYSEIPSLDCFGLSDAYIAHRVPASSNRPGHQKYAPLEYQLARRPTIITSNYYRIADAAYVPSEAEAAMWRARGYRYVSVRIEGLVPPWYSYLERIGFERPPGAAPE